MRILLLGDIHGEIEIAKKIIDSVKCDYVFQTGDMEVYSDFSKPVYFIAGNHENWDILRGIDANRIRFKNLYHIKTAEIIKLVKNKETLTLSGINGNYSEKRYSMKIKERERHFNKKEVERCRQLKNIDIFLSHEVPADIGFIKNGKDVGINPIKEILDKIKPKFLFFCHHHVFFEKMVGITKVIGLNYARNEYGILDTDKNEIERFLLK